MTEALSYETVDVFRDFLKETYLSGGLHAVGAWVNDHLTPGAILRIGLMPSGTADNAVTLCDRAMELLNPMNNQAVTPPFLPLLSPNADRGTCDIYLSVRILFIPEPFGVVLYKEKQS